MLTKILHFVQNDAPGRNVLLSHCSRPGRWYAVPKGGRDHRSRRVLRIDRPMGRRVLKFDGAFCPEGCGIALTVHSEHILKER